MIIYSCDWFVADDDDDDDYDDDGAFRPRPRAGELAVIITRLLLVMTMVKLMMTMMMLMMTMLMTMMMAMMMVRVQGGPQVPSGRGPEQLG